MKYRTCKGAIYKTRSSAIAHRNVVAIHSNETVPYVIHSFQLYGTTAHTYIAAMVSSPKKGCRDPRGPFWLVKRFTSVGDLRNDVFIIADHVALNNQRVVLSFIYRFSNQVSTTLRFFQPLRHLQTAGTMLKNKIHAA